MTHVIASTTRTARKQHQCSYMAGCTIEPGQRYSIQFNDEGDSVYTWKSCEFHDTVAAFIFANWQPDYISAEEMSDHLHEMWHDAEREHERGRAYIMPF